MRKYICATKVYSTIENHISAPVFKSVFDCETTENSILQISVVGFYRLFLNGKDITKGYFAPYIHNPDDVVYYDEYDVSSYLNKKDNVLCVVLGSGFANAKDNNIWQFESASFRSSPKMYLSLRSGENEILCSDRDFKVAEYPITFEDLRCGEHYDARLENKNLFEPFFDSTFCEVLLAEPPKGIYKKCDAQPVKAFETIKPVNIIKSDNGYIYDFGICCSGIFKLFVNGKSGQKIDLTFGEMVSCGKLDMSGLVFNDPPLVVTPDGYIQHDVYICKDGIQEYTPSFTYHGYRYCLVEGIAPEQATNELLQMIPVHTDFTPRGFFKCENETVNKIEQISLNSAESNFVHIITDCPQREKNGWTSEGHVTAEYIMYSYECSPTLKEWLYNIRLAQREDGAIPGIIPTGGWGFAVYSGPQWDRIIVELPVLLYKFTGDKQVMKDNAETVYKYIGYLRSKVNENGLLGFGLIDWCEAGGKGDGDCSTPLEITDTLISVDLLKKSKEIFEISGLIDRIACVDEFIELLLCNFRKKYVAGNKLTFETQTAQALAIKEGVFEEKDIPQAFEELVKIIERDDCHMKCGVLGYREVFNLLAESGRADLALKMMMQETSPSYANIINQGATSLWEKFTEYYETPDGMRQRDGHHRNYSLNHSAFGGVSSWFYKYLAGIRIVSHDEIIISPCTQCNVGKINAEFNNFGKTVKVEIEPQNDNFKITVFNSGFKCNIMLAGKKIFCDNGITSVTV